MIGLALITSLGACIADPDFVTGEDKKDLLQAYRAQSQQALERRAHEEAKAIRVLRLNAPDESRLPQLSVDLVQADLNRVMARILSDPNVAYRNGDIRFHGRVSARFKDRPLVEGLNLILAGTGILAQADDQVLSFGYDDAATDSGEADGSSLTISREIALRHLSSSDVVTLLENLYPRDYGDEENLSVGNVPELNSVFLSGSAEQVTEAAHLVARADRPVAARQLQLAVLQ
ncbi:MAG: secretin N-terminal domain-containing protein [Pseudomonadota bacterium]|nr:secretin N-terminal domain-containing protein [Pseudomonadota bacterium]